MGEKHSRRFYFGDGLKTGILHRDQSDLPMDEPKVLEDVNRVSGQDAYLLRERQLFNTGVLSCTYFLFLVANLVIPRILWEARLPGYYGPAWNWNWPLSRMLETLLDHSALALAYFALGGFSAQLGVLSYLTTWCGTISSRLFARILLSTILGGLLATALAIGLYSAHHGAWSLPQNWKGVGGCVLAYVVALPLLFSARVFQGEYVTLSVPGLAVPGRRVSILYLLFLTTVAAIALTVMRKSLTEFLTSTELIDVFFPSRPIEVTRILELRMWQEILSSGLLLLQHVVFVLLVVLSSALLVLREAKNWQGIALLSLLLVSVPLTDFLRAEPSAMILVLFFLLGLSAVSCSIFLVLRLLGYQLAKFPSKPATPEASLDIHSDPL